MKPTFEFGFCLILLASKFAVILISVFDFAWWFWCIHPNLFEKFKGSVRVLNSGRGNGVAILDIAESCSQMRPQYSCIAFGNVCRGPDRGYRPLFNYLLMLDVEEDISFFFRFLEVPIITIVNVILF